MAQTAHGGRLEREHVLNPVTALAFISSAATQEQFLLAGEDTDLKVYKPTSSHIHAQLPIFDAQSIHGIAVPPSSDPSSPPTQTPVIVWGAHNVAILPTPLVCHLLGGVAGDSKIAVDGLDKSTIHVEAPDWILDAAISPVKNERFALLTAHNEIILGTVDAESGHASLDSITSLSRPILYSGSLTWVSGDCILVAAGTVFGEIVVWKCQLEQNPASNPGKPRAEVLFVFSGHEGSIFGVHMSPEIRMPSGDRVRLLASCSDDRTVRIWDITEKGDGAAGQGQNSAHETLTPDARETGFGDNTEPLTENQSLSRCLATAMGHVSRIWHVEFPEVNNHDLNAGFIPIYSFGEDATAQRWHLFLPGSQLSTENQHQGKQFPNGSGPKLSHQSTFSSHSGKHIWSRALTTDGRGQTLIATGGADGKIVLTRDNAQGQGLQPYQLVALSVTEVAEASKRGNPENARTGTMEAKATSTLTKPQRLKNSRESFQRYGFVTDSRLIVVTNYGRVYVGDFGTTLEWDELVLPDEITQALVNYSVLEVSRVKQLAFFGTSSGEILYFRNSVDASLQPLTKVHGKVADMFCLPARNDGSSGTEETPGSELLVTVLGDSKASLLQLDCNVSVLDNIEVSLEEGCVVTSAIFHGKYLVIGSRAGTLTVLAPFTSQGFVPVVSVTVRLNDAVTCIQSIPTSPGHLLATCRDGKYRIYSLSETGECVALNLLSEVSPPFGPLIEGAWFVDGANGNKDLLLCGFRSKHAVLWNETQRRELMTVECGGAHRSFAYTPVRASPDGIRFVFSKASQMHIFSQTTSPIRTIKPGGHGREIRAVCTWGNLVATAAEDTQIRVWEHVRATSRGGTWNEPFSCRAVLDKHATGIQAMKWYENRYLFSSGGNEEFFIWKINRLSHGINDNTTPASCCQLGVICEATFPDRSADGDLRIMNFDVKSINNNDNVISNSDKSANTTSGSEDEMTFCITMALSNSTIQTYKYSRSGGFVLLGRCNYTGACLTQLHHLPSLGDGPSGSNNIPGAALTAATDGHLAVFDDLTSVPAAHDGDNDGERSSSTTTRLHQSSVKALDIRKVHENKENAATSHYLIATGGDDNALGITLLVVSRKNSSTATPLYEFRGKWAVRSAHAAAVTGVKFLGLAEDSNGSQGEASAAIVMSISNDQRVRTWRLSGWGTGNGKLRVERVSDRYSSVADAGDMDVLTDGKVLVGGVGMEVWGVEGW